MFAIAAAVAQGIRDGNLVYGVDDSMINEVNGRAHGKKLWRRVVARFYRCY
jgi:hypothetical protein